MSVIGHSPLAGASGAAGGGDPLYVDDVFSTFLYDGTGSTQSINNGIDLSGEGGMVWVKSRSDTSNHRLVDTERGAYNNLSPDTNAANFNNSTIFSSFDSDGFSVATDAATNYSGRTYASWTFRKAPGFFDVVTWTGNGISGRQISHSLGSTPGCIFLKKTSSGGINRNWWVWHRSIPSTLIILNQTAAAGSYSGLIGSVSSASFEVGSDENTNASGSTYVAYVFAHDDQSFGTNSDESIIKCGSYTSVYPSDTPVNLGFEPQFLLIKRSSNSADWVIYDNMRGVVTGGNDAVLRPSSTAAESSGDLIDFTPTGFIAKGTSSFSNYDNGDTFIYMAIRRPHKPPTAGTDVLAVNTRNGNQTAGTLSTAGFPVDLAIISARNVAHWTPAFDRLRGPLRFLGTQILNAEASYNNTLTGFDSNTAIEIGTDSTNLGVNRNSQTYVDFLFKRAPGFFDIVAYTGNGVSGKSISHSLGSVPGLVIIKNRDETNSWNSWNRSITSPNSNWWQNYLTLNTTNAAGSWTTGLLAEPTSASFTVGTGGGVNNSGVDYIAYLFATLDGISKVGSYSGTGSNINVDCGFTAGARFVLIKRTDSTGDWYVWDTARGIVSGNDPYLLLNSTAAEVTNTDFIDPLNAGFTVTSSAPAALNTSGGTYIFLAIA